MYCHYIGQYIYLQLIGTSVSYFGIEAFMLRIEYQQDGMRPEKEIGTIAVGPATNMIIFMGWMVIATLFQWWLDYFPEHGCRFVAAWGIMTVLDPIWVLIVDLCINNTQYGDSWKLYNKFYADEGSGVTGIFVTVCVYCLLMAWQVVILFYYLLAVHMNGHMQDVYARLHGAEFDEEGRTFFVPYDGEVSWKELQYECYRAQEWRGSEGELRKVQVVDYLHRDRYDSQWEEKTTVTSIYTQTQSGTKQIHRQFVRLPVGCIVERFGTERVELGHAPDKKKRHRRSSGGGAYGMLLDALGGGGLEQRKPAGKAVGPSALSEIAANAEQPGGKKKHN